MQSYGAVVPEATVIALCEVTSGAMDDDRFAGFLLHCHLLELRHSSKGYSLQNRPAMTPPPSPSRRPVDSRSPSKFQLPIQAKAVLFLAVAGALASITRVEQAFHEYPISAERLLRSATTMAFVSPESMANRYPRVVLLGPAVRDIVSLPDAVTTPAQRPRRTVDTTYTLDLRNWKQAKNTTTEEVDDTRFYPVGNSKDDFRSMERRRWPRHEWDPHCEPSAKWQSHFHPVCNDIHAVADLQQALVTEQLSLLSSKGFWRHAWHHAKENTTETTVWKTFK